MARKTLMAVAHWVTALLTLGFFMAVVVTHTVPALGAFAGDWQTPCLIGAALSLVVHVVIVQAQVGAEGGDR